MDSVSLENEFVGVTGGTREQAAFFLGAHNNDLQAAILSYFENPNAASAKPQPELAPVRAGVAAGSSSQAKSRIVGLGDVLARNDKSKDAEEGKNTYFAGGGKNSGIAVQGPSEGSSDKKAVNLVQDILKQAAEHVSPIPSLERGVRRLYLTGNYRHGPRPGGEDGTDDDDDEMEENSPVGRKQRSTFVGAGYRLGSEEDSTSTESSRPIAQTSGGTSSSTSSSVVDRSGGKLPKVTRTLTFWKTGFNIDDGPLMEYDKPENQQILEALKSGRAPMHILNIQSGQPVDMKVEHKLEEQYQPPPMKPFAGTGQRLGSVVPNEYSNSVLPGGFPSVTSSTLTNSSVAPSTMKLRVDENKPVTTLQIRLADGTRLVSKFNHDHTVGDIRDFINRSSEGNRSYVMQTTFPNRELHDTAATLKDAGVLNAVIIQRYT